MTPEQKKFLRDALLAALVASGPLSLPLSTLKMAARAAGFPVDDAILEMHIDYLVQKGFVEIKKVEVSAGLKRWKATAAGIEYCESEGLV